MAELPEFEAPFRTAKGREAMLNYKPATTERRMVQMGECLNQLGMHSFVGRTLLVTADQILGIKMAKPAQFTGVLTGYDYPETLVLNMDHVLMYSVDEVADAVHAQEFIQVPLQKITRVACTEVQSA